MTTTNTEETNTLDRLADFYEYFTSDELIKELIDEMYEEYRVPKVVSRLAIKKVAPWVLKRAGEAGKKLTGEALKTAHQKLTEKFSTYRWLTQNILEVIEAKVSNDLEAKRALKERMENVTEALLNPDKAREIVGNTEVFNQYDPEQQAWIALISKVESIDEKLDYIIELTKENYERQLREKTGDLKVKTEKLMVEMVERRRSERTMDLLETQIDILQKQNETLQNLIGNIDGSYKQHTEFLKERIVALEEFKGEVPDEDLDAAKRALEQGETAKADRLFADIEKKEQASIKRAAEAAYQRGKIAEDNIDYYAAYERYQRAAQLVPENSEYLVVAGNLASEIALYDKAISYYEAALTIQITEKGEVATEEVALLWNNLGISWVEKGEFDKAIRYFEQALAVFRQVFGEEHPKVSINWSNLGAAWAEKGEYNKAIDYYEKALVVDCKLYGDGHPNVATRWFNLGNAWKNKGEIDQAIGYYEKALAAFRQVFGDEHPTVAINWNNLGMAWADKGDYDKAIEYYKMALAVDRKAFGDEHPTVAINWNSLGMAWADKGDYDKAIEYYEKALAVNRKVFGDGHPSVATVWNNLGVAWKHKGEIDKAIWYYEQALRVWSDRLGDDHQYTNIVRNNLQEAKQMLEKKKKQ